MQRPSIAGTVFLCIFGAPFAAMGLFFAFQSARSGSNKPGAFGVLFGSFFACIGFGLMAAAILGYRKLNQEMDVHDAHPDQPWVWRTDWAAGRADGGDPKANITAWVFTAFWDFISIAVTAGVLPQAMAKGQLAALFVLIFPIAGIIITAYTIRGTLRIQRYGRTSFRFESVPFTPGGKLKGVIQLKLPTTTPHGVDLVLSCKRRVVTGSGKNRTVNEIVLWQDSRNVPAEGILRGLGEAQIPVEFAIPADAYETDEDNSNDRVFWQLHASADVPGVDYVDNYELPVFRTQAAAATVATGAGFGDLRSAFKPIVQDAPETPVSAPVSTSIVYNEAENSFYFPPMRSVKQALISVAFATVWTGVVYMLWARPDAPWLFRIIFTLSEIIAVLFVMSAFFGNALLRVREGMFEVRNAMYGFGNLRRYSFNDVTSISPLSQGQANTSGQVQYGISVRTSDGKSTVIAANSLTLTEARWVVSTLERAMGRAQDTRVQFQSMYGAPPQRAGVSNSPGMATPLSAGGVQLHPRATPKKLGIFGFGIWLLIVGSMFYSFFSRVHFNSSTSTNARVRQVARVSYQPMTDADAERITTLPIQGQAEELLERAIGHDERAIEMLTNSVEGWTSEVRLTERMKALQARAMYSRDLRVRQASADLDLAMDGWHRDPDAVAGLIERARTDQQYRATAYYFLGMEAGRGVDAEHAFAELSEHALHDPDATVRQWAVEGLRFLKTDEALDVLYESFTTDPSFAVRDRAGCNVSDCGVFTRTQRMRLVPKLIELSSDPNQNGQMHNWAFMALNGITDAAVPANTEAWRKWYAEHGAEKMQEFESLSWYQVRGDE